MTDISNIKLTPKQNLLAVFFIALILIALGLRLYFSGKALEFSGPNFVVSTASTAVMVYNTDIYRLNDKGHVLQKIAFTDIGLTNKAADIQLLDDDRFVIGDWDNERILLCQFKNSKCDSLTKNLGEELGNFFKVHYRETENDIFIADTDHHRILHYDINTHKIKEISSKKQFIYPNHLQIEKDGYLYITDTNHHRIASFEYDNDKLVQVGEDIRIPKDASSKKWPIHYTIRDNGDMYALQGNNFLLYADLVYLPVTGTAENIPLAKDADITTLTLMGSKILMSDRKLFTLNSLDVSTHEISEFGSDELKAIFLKDKRTATLFDILSMAMLALMIAFIIGMVAFIIYLMKEGSREEPKESVNKVSESNLPPITPGVLIWLDPNPFLRRVLLVLFVLVFAIIALSYGIINFLKFDLSNLEHGSSEQTLVNLFIVIGLTFIIVLINAVHNIYYSIGTDGIYIYVKTIFSKAKFEPQKAFYNKQTILKGSMSVLYRNNIQQYFHNKEQFEAYITPLLNAYATKINMLQVMKHMVLNPNGLFIFNTISFGLILYYFIKSGVLFG